MILSLARRNKAHLSRQCVASRVSLDGMVSDGWARAHRGIRLHSPRSLAAMINRPDRYPYPKRSRDRFCCWGLKEEGD